MPSSWGTGGGWSAGARAPEQGSAGGEGLDAPDGDLVCLGPVCGGTCQAALLQASGQDSSIVLIHVAAGGGVGGGGAGSAQRGCGTPTGQAGAFWDRASTSHLPQLGGGGRRGPSPRPPMLPYDPRRQR